MVSAGGSAPAASDCPPMSPAIPASVSPPTNLRRLQLSRRSLMDTSFTRHQSENRFHPDFTEAICHESHPFDAPVAVRITRRLSRGVLRRRLEPEVGRLSAA